MTASKYGGGESLLLICGRAYPEAETSGRVQGRHDQTELTWVVGETSAKFQHIYLRPQIHVVSVTLSFSQHSVLSSPPT